MRTRRIIVGLSIVLFGASIVIVALELLAPAPKDLGQIPKKEAETAPATKAAIARPEATDAGKAGGREPPRQEACTEAVAALGLCTPRPTQERK
jgi:hypothetical protein